MMQPLVIPPSDSTPAINFDPKIGSFDITGESRPEDAQKFYKQIFDWMDLYYSICETNKPTQKLVFKFYFEYFNSTSAKFLMTLINRIEKLKQIDVNAEVQWHYYHEDIDMKEMGMEFSNLVSVPFNFISIE